MRVCFLDFSVKIIIAGLTQIEDFAEGLLQARFK